MVSNNINRKTIAFATGSRADYGIMRHYLEKLNNDKDIDLQIIVTGALLDEAYGHQVDLIYEDGFKVSKEVKVNINSSSNYNVLHTMSDVLDKFSKVFSENKYDLIIILGDRYEMLSVATAAAMNRIPILHIHGGEATYANYDEFIRHCITKMSLYHFTATEEYKKRVIQLGENPKNVFNLGALGAENCMNIDINNVGEEVKKIKEKNYFVVLFHPETLTNIDVSSQIKELLNAIDQYSQYKYVFIGANADTHSDVIRRLISNYVNEHDNSIYFENLHTDAYHYLLKNSICLIGNSSSGIIEAPSLGVYTINIGDRQKGRVQGNSVLNTRCNKDDIVKAMKYVIDKYKCVEPINPYYQKDSSLRYYQTTKDLLSRVKEDTFHPKEFYDINCIKEY